MSLKFYFKIIIVIFFFCSCFQAEDLNRKAEIKEDKEKVRFELITSGIKNPWGMVFPDNRTLLITEKSGEIRVIKDGQLLKQKIRGVPRVHQNGQGGLLDIALHPRFSKNKLLYLSYSNPEGGSGSNTSVLRAKFEDNQLKDKKIIYKASPNSTKGQHYGSRLVFDRKESLYFSIGDRGDRELYPQRLDLDGGKIYRLKDNGNVPEDNPFVDVSNAKPEIFSYGHRNPQGLALHPVSGKIWSHEHGPRGGDEINIINSGANYGWPILSYGINYIGTSFAEGSKREGMESPQAYYSPSIAPCGMTFIRGGKYPGWKNDIILGSLKFNYLIRVNLDGDKIISHEVVAKGIGRVRNVKQGPDGFIYVGVEGKGLYRLLPRK